MPFRLIHFDINVARAADGTRCVERLRSCGICLTVQQILSLTLDVLLPAVELHEFPPVSAFVNRTVDSCAGQAEGLSIVSFSCYCRIYVGSETAPADAVADPLLRPCSERSVFWGGVGVGERPVATLALWELP